MNFFFVNIINLRDSFLGYNDLVFTLLSIIKTPDRFDTKIFSNYLIKGILSSKKM